MELGGIQVDLNMTKAVPMDPKGKQCTHALAGTNGPRPAHLPDGLLNVPLGSAGNNYCALWPTTSTAPDTQQQLNSPQSAITRCEDKESTFWEDL